MTVASSQLEDAIRAVSRFLVAKHSIGDTLTEIAQLASQAIPAADAVGVTLLKGRNRPVTAVSTDDAATRVDQAQYDDDTGPCLDAYRIGHLVRVDDAAAERYRWPKFSKAAVKEGLCSSLSMPLIAGDDVYGAFNLYARIQHSFSLQDGADAELFAIQAAVVLANADAYWAAADLASGLKQAMESRALIEQAKGKLMATADCTADEAFQMLVKASQRTNVKLRDLAVRIVQGSALGNLEEARSAQPNGEVPSPLGMLGQHKPH